MQTVEQQTSALLDIGELLEQGKHDEVDAQVNELHPAEIAHVLEALPPEQRDFVWNMVNPEHDGDILTYVNDEVRSHLIREMDEHELVAATENLETDDLADLLPDLPETVISELLKAMDEQNRHRLESVLQYPEDTAGGLMSVDTITIRPDVTLDVVMRYMRLHNNLPESTDSLIVVNRDDKFLGVLTLLTLVSEDQSLTVAEVFKRDVTSIIVNMPSTDVANIFEKRNLVSAPVIDEDGRLLGRITIDDVVDVIREEADHSLMSMAGLDEEDDMFAPVVRSSRRRAVWLGVNLLTALLASWVIGMFDATIEKLVALAVLMPIVASMGGIAGSQTLTLVTRGIALGKVGRSNQARLLRKEMAVGVLNGILWALVIGLLAGLWFSNIMLGGIIAVAILVNLMVAAFAGAIIPILLHRFGADPALAGSVVLTTVTDVVGFFAFLGLATMFLI